MGTNWVKYGWTYVIRKIDLLIYKKSSEYNFGNMETVYISIEKGTHDPLLSMKNLLNIVEDDDMVSGNMKHICAQLYSIEKIYNHPEIHIDSYSWIINVPIETKIEFANYIRNSLITKYRLKLIGHFDVL